MMRRTQYNEKNLTVSSMPAGILLMGTEELIVSSMPVGVYIMGTEELIEAGGLVNRNDSTSLDQRLSRHMQRLHYLPGLR